MRVPTSDRVTICDQNGKPRYIVQGKDVQPHPNHEHVFGWLGRRCTICHKTKREINQESK